ncbi:hypothetical protein ACHAXR_012300 [Thalassiosira sp. AJA248-18]
MLLRSGNSNIIINQRARRRYICLATILCRAVTSSASASGSSSNNAACTSPTTPEMKMYPLIDKWRQSQDSWLLRFALPPDQKYLGSDPSLPTCISVHHDSKLTYNEDDNNNKPVGLLKKSYSPVSHPATVGTFDLLVKSYPPQPGGGVGDAICNLQIGNHLVGKLKSERLVHGSPIISKRWDRVGLIAGGTGVAPLIQLARIILEDPMEDDTKIYLLSINRNEEDILMRGELDQLAKDHPERFKVSYSLTGTHVRSDWSGYTGRGSISMAQETLPPPSSSASADGKRTMIFVCGTDGFRDHWSGPIARGPNLPDGTRGAKIQGPLLGLLRDAGYDASDVFKY